jgi:aliphatic nitrilase
MVMADLDLSLVAKRKRMMDSVGHYSRPELLSVLIDRSPQPHLREKSARLPDRTSHESLASASNGLRDEDAPASTLS